MYADNDYPEPRTREDQLLDITNYDHEMYSETNIEDSFESIISDSDIIDVPIELHAEIDNSIENVENLENIVGTSTPINPFSDEPLDTNNLDTLFSPFGITGDTSETSYTVNIIPETEEELYILREIQTLEFVNKLRMLSGDQYPIIEPIINNIIDLISEKQLGFDCETITDSRGVDTIIHLYDKTIHDQDKYTIIASFRESDQMAYP